MVLDTEIKLVLYLGTSRALFSIKGLVRPCTSVAKTHTSPILRTFVLPPSGLETVVSIGLETALSDLRLEAKLPALVLRFFSCKLLLGGLFAHKQYTQLFLFYNTQILCGLSCRRSSMLGVLKMS